LWTSRFSKDLYTENGKIVIISALFDKIKFNVKFILRNTNNNAIQKKYT